MQLKKSSPIDLSREYPCPCRRRGQLKPIILTDAFGCDRCQQIFVVAQSGRVIEQLATTYPYERSWRWTGNRWIVKRPPPSKYYLSLFGILALLILIAGLSIWRSGFTHIFLPVLVVLLVIVPAFAIWLSYR
ncbi:hypothetical protein [Spirulina sp. 06S082]|uniref:hypothetical protein n=1 Tax=Spirulina sp. 06S082 TaxID=3110248 RepID=UPI002B201A3F|nr:hypothetical protein [Spirulina sp. 06S082]MEA5468248.1 hypothetical protein [Spirulina sp. 06S082]